MGLTSIDFNQIENINNTPTGLNINKAINFTQQLVISSVPPAQENTSNIWFNKTTEELKIRINNTTYDLKPKETLSNITISSNLTLNLNGKRGIVNNLTVTGTNTVLTVRTGSLGWSILEVQGNLTVPTGCTLNLIRTPLIVRGNIIGGGTISSPNGVNGGLGGIGGPGGAGGPATVVEYSPNGSLPGGNGSASVATWPNINGGSAVSMEVEYGVSSGKGGDGGRGTGGGGGGGWIRNGGSSGLGSNQTYAGGVWKDGNNASPIISNVSLGGGGGGAGGVGGVGVFFPSSYTTALGGIGTTGQSGNAGSSAQSLNIPYIGISTPSLNSSGSVGTFGGQGGIGGQGIYSPLVYPTAGSPGGTGGNGGPGGSTGGAHLTVFCVGDISSSITFRSGRGGINGGSTSFAGAQSGSIWLFNKYGTTAPSTPGTYDIIGITATPPGDPGTVNRILISDNTSVNNFFRDILYNINGLTPAKDIISITI
jgi:hypothetical protein